MTEGCRGTNKTHMGNAKKWIVWIIWIFTSVLIGVNLATGIHVSERTILLRMPASEVREHSEGMEQVISEVDGRLVDSGPSCGMSVTERNNIEIDRSIREINIRIVLLSVISVYLTAGTIVFFLIRKKGRTVAHIFTTLIAVNVGLYFLLDYLMPVYLVR